MKRPRRRRSEPARHSSVADSTRAAAIRNRALVLAGGRVHNASNPRRGGMRGIRMDELIARLVNNLGIDRDAAEKAVAVMLGFLKKEAPAEKVQPLIDKLPGAEELMESQEGLDASGGAMFAMGGIM